jgi:predicted DNA-binding transcriptional regulator YafY
MARWLLSFAGSAEALEPAELRDRVLGHARSVLEKHQAAAVC